MSATSGEPVAVWDAENGMWATGRVPEGVKVPSPLCIFGYGSLCWKPQPEFEGCPSFVGVIHGWQRRFAQRSLDHRGTPAQPGWTVTCVADADLEALGVRDPRDPPSATHGVCYAIPDSVAAQVLQDLDVREKGGYTRAVVEVEPLDPESGAEAVRALLYTGTTDNPLFELQPLENIARDIASAEGPSGPNLEYLEMLAAFLDTIGVRDSHIAGLMEQVTALRCEAGAAAADALKAR